jgi:hypothetical protein
VKRYQVLGLVPEEHEENETVLTESQQRTGDGPVVYETDSTEEARQIHNQGGFTGRDGSWVVVTGIRDTEAVESAVTTRKPPLEK